PVGSFPRAGGTALGPYDGLCASNCCFPHAVIGGGASVRLCVLPLQIPDRSVGSCGTRGPDGWPPRLASRRAPCANARDETSSTNNSTVHRRINTFRI